MSRANQESFPTPLFFRLLKYSADGDLEGLRSLIEMGVNLDQPHLKGILPLHIATVAGHIEYV